jgi:hypothetical protein
VRIRLIMLAMAFSVLTSCTSPEAGRTRGGGPGADVGNRSTVMQMHEGSRPFEKTPKLISVQPPPLASANQADQLSRK